MKLGIDIGRVIIHGGTTDLPDTQFIGGDFNKAMQVPPANHAFESILALTDAFEPKNVWLVSKCGKRIQERTKTWLQRHRFWVQTGMNPNNIRFCRKRHEKAPICKELGITHFIDDRLDCLMPMEDIVPHRFLFGRRRNGVSIPEGIVPVADWDDTLCEVLASLKRTPQ